MWSGRVYELNADGIADLSVDIVQNASAEEIEGNCGPQAVSGAFVNKYLDAGLLDMQGGMARVDPNQCFPYRKHEIGDVLSYGVNVFSRPLPHEMIDDDSVWLTEWIDEPTGPQITWRVVGRADLLIGPPWAPTAFEGGSVGAGAGFEVDKKFLIAGAVSLGLYLLFAKMKW